MRGPNAKKEGFLMSYTIFHRWSVAGKGRYRACTYNLPPVVGGVYNLPPVVGGVEAEVARSWAVSAGGSRASKFWGSKKFADLARF